MACQSSRNASDRWFDPELPRDGGEYRNVNATDYVPHQIVRRNSHNPQVLRELALMERRETQKYLFV
jgi:hypothetical protein